MSLCPQTTFIIPLRIDSEDRLANAKINLKLLLEILKVKIVLIENGPKSYYAQIVGGMEIQGLDYEFQESHDKLFHRTHIINQALKKVNTKFVAILDIDVLLPISSYIKAEELLSQDIDFVYPFRSNYFYAIDQKDKDAIDLFDIKKIKTLNLKLINHENLLGFIIFFKTNVYRMNGGENIDFKGWGFEDDERYNRFMKLGFKCARVEDDVFHLEHWRGENSDFTCPFIEANRNLFNTLKNYTLEEYKFYCLFHGKAYYPASSLYNYLIPYLQGGLGNQLFQIASAYGIAKRNNKEFIISQKFKNENIHSCINYFETIFKNIKQTKNNFNVNVYSERDEDYSKFIDVKLGEGNILLRGYFQNEKYFSDYKDEISKLFILPELNSFGSLEKSMFIHLRYFSPEDGYLVHNIDMTIYLENIIKILGDRINDIHFYILSNNLTYVTQKYNLDKFVNKTLVHNLNEIESICLMSKCNLGGICTNSTLGWWGGYLNASPNKKIFYPDKNLNNNFPCDIFSSDMIIVPT